MPELPEVESARQVLLHALDREIVAVDDTDHVGVPPARPGRDRRGAGRRQADRGPPAGEVDVVRDARSHRGARSAPRHPPRHGWADRRRRGRSRRGGWDRFALEFADGGRLALRDKRRLGRAVIEPDFSHVGPDAAEVGRGRLPRPGRPRHGAAEGAAARPGRDRRGRQPARRRDAVAGPPEPAASGRRAVGRRARPAAASAAGRHARRRSATAASTPGASCRRAEQRWIVPALQDPARARHGRRAHHVLVPHVPAGLAEPDRKGRRDHCRPDHQTSPSRQSQVELAATGRAARRPPAARRSPPSSSGVAPQPAGRQRRQACRPTAASRGPA